MVSCQAQGVVLCTIIITKKRHLRKKFFQKCRLVKKLLALRNEESPSISNLVERKKKRKVRIEF